MKDFCIFNVLSDKLRKNSNISSIMGRFSRKDRTGRLRRSSPAQKTQKMNLDARFGRYKKSDYADTQAVIFSEPSQ